MSFRKRVPALTVGAMIALSPLSGAVGTAPALAISAEEQAFVDAINASRAAAGLAPLTVDEQLSVLADRHSGRMAAANTIFHSSDLAGTVGSVHPTWTRIGENVGMGSSVDSIHSAMLASPNHAANIYGDYNLLGIGVYTNPGGKMFVTEIFVKAAVTTTVNAVESLAPTTTVTETTTAAAAPAPAPTTVVTETATATASNNGGGGKARTATSSSSAKGAGSQKAARAGKSAASAGNPNRSAMGEARNAAHSGGRRGAPEWAQNDKKK